MTMTTPPATFPVANAHRICRLCLHPRTPTTRSNLTHLDWFKWPNARITHMYEQVVGKQLPVSEQLGELYCETCYEWLDHTLLRIAEFNRISAMWADHLASLELDVEIQVKSEVLLLDDQRLAAAGPSLHITEIKLDCDDVCAEEVEHLEYDDYDDGVDDAENDEDDDADQAMMMDSEILEPSVADHVEFNDNADDDDDQSMGTEILESNFAYNEENNDNEDEEPILGCDMCDATFADKTALLPHFRTVHSLDVNEAGYLTKHLATQNQPLPFACDFCPRRYKVERHLLRHRALNHTDDGPGLRCRFCSQQFAHTKTRRVHYATCAAKLASAVRKSSVRPSPSADRSQLFCQHCTAAYLRPKTLLRHYETAHPAADWSAVERCICVRCFRQFDSESEASAHFEEVHERWRCTVCSKLCMCAQSLTRHMRRHSTKERRFRCAECEGRFVSSHQLKMHQRRKHTDERPFACEAVGCEKRYAERSELNIHVKAAHSAIRYACEWCEDDFNSEKYLAEHTAKKHTGDFQYFVCSRCEGGERKFVNSRLLNAHMVVHHGVGAAKLEAEPGVEVVYKELVIGI